MSSTNYGLGLSAIKFDQIFSLSHFSIHQGESGIRLPIANELIILKRVGPKVGF